ncbi:DUF4139 domain-containing protein [Marinobacterium weihaiense]|uniref:DUF4139 domain-containing protein n=1 Tax=Marinobacterium weihaiense TaxID=2851016 RepID=A0ABS6M8X6_9GAMM|nr:DUF4139 domain-containing protein [Marinobacterium weihaiense]MBV0932737.1 DUF4139 domain-containing protein [Marinobacterium weihaiense]
MLKMRYATPVGLTLGLLSTPALWAQPTGEYHLDESSRGALALTLYQQNLALVEERRAVPELKPGSRVILQGISPQMQAQTLQISGAGEITEQNLEQNLISLNALLQARIGQTITLARFNSVTGSESRQQARLLKAEGNQVLVENDSGQIESLPLNHGNWRVIFDTPAQHYALKPRLSFTSQGLTSPGQAQLRYLTHGLSWSMDYVINLDADGSSLSLQGLATLNNQSGLTWPDARIKLLAGQVNQPAHMRQAEAMMARAAPMDKAGSSNSPGAVQDYHLYTLPQPLTLNDQQQKQVPLIQRDGVLAEIRYHQLIRVAAHQQMPPQQQQADIRLSFAAPEMDGVKTPLPAGQARVFRPDDDGQLQFVGGSHLQATATGDRAELALGKAFDVGVEYRQTAFSKVFDGYEVSYSVTLNNRSDNSKPFTLNALMPMPYTLEDTDMAPSDTSASMLEWTFELAPGEEKQLNFSARLIKS